MEIKSGYYRISVNALILNEERDKFLVCKKVNGNWVLPGGGLDWGETPHEGIVREIKEEMVCTVTNVADKPSYFLTTPNRNKDQWVANVVYETQLESLAFTPTDECVEIKFINKDDLTSLNLPEKLEKFARMFNA